MDRTGPRLGLLILAAGLIAAAAPRALPIHAAQWLAPEGRLKALSEQPVECAKPPISTADRTSFEIGRTAFRTPTLLGGQAARAGLSCESCHGNGRRNAAFLFPGLSDARGTADVTSSLMSSHRGNGSFDPRPIPDLAFPAKVSRDPDDPALERFIRGLIVEEFDGAEPEPRILHGLAVYVRSIAARGCPTGKTEPVRLRAAIANVRRAAEAAGTALALGDGRSAHLLLSGARAMLGRIDERFALSGMAAERAGLAAADAGLRDIQRAVERDPKEAASLLSAWEARISGWSRPLLRGEGRSLYARRRLAEALRR